MEQLTIQQENYCQRRCAGDTQRKAYRSAYPRSQKWKDSSVDVNAAKLEAHAKVSQRLKELSEDAARHAVLTRTALINRIADVNRLSYDSFIASATTDTDDIEPAIDTSAAMAFSRTSKHLLEYQLVNDAEDTDAEFVADYGLLLPSSFVDVHRDIHNHAYTDYAFKGGRGSGKSSAIALEIPKLMLKNPSYEAVVLRQVFNTLRKSVYAKLKWAIKALGLEDDFHFSLSPLEIKYIPTGQKIYFIGLNDPDNLKSFTCEVGYPAIQWYEEYHQFSPDDQRSANQSLARGGSTFWRFFSWNPPRSKTNWVNEWARQEIPGRIVHHSTYHDVPTEWLGQQFTCDAEALLTINKDAHDHEYGGLDVGTDGEVFQNIIEREITDEEIAALPYIRGGIDWGYNPDPFIFGQVGYDRKTKTVYILNESFGTRLSDEQAAKAAIKIMTEIELQNGKEVEVYHASAKHNEVYCDSAEPKSVASFREYGINALSVKKFKGSIDAGIKWLQTRTAIVIDPKRAPLSAQEFNAYEYEDDGQGGLKTYPDKNNHSIDKARYALAPLIAARKET
jgi:PBSX family phage terminase large subunit